jgi:hypothetical protein
MTNKGKQKILIFLGLALLLTAVLAASLSQIELKPGLPPPAWEGGRIILPEYAASNRINLQINPFILRLLGILLAAFVLVVLYSLVMGTDWKKLLSNLREFVLILSGFIIIILFIYFLANSFIQTAPRLPLPAPSEPPLTAPVRSIPTSLTWLVGVCLAFLAAFLLYIWIRARRKPAQVDLLAEQIEKARQNLLAGMEPDEVILRCYQEMSRVLQQFGGIERQVFITPSEFEIELFAAGFPKEPVHQLTHLFEIARYGRNAPTSVDEQEALRSLQKLITYLHEGKEASR